MVIGQHLHGLIIPHASIAIKAVELIFFFFLM